MFYFRSGIWANRLCPDGQKPLQLETSVQRLQIDKIGSVLEKNI